MWVTTMDGVLDAADGSLRAGLVQIDARTGEITRRIHVTVSDVGPVEAGAGAVWFVPDDSQARDLVERRDPATGRRVADVTSDYNSAMAAGAELLWGMRRDGAVAEIDPRRNRIVAEVPGVYVTPAEQGGPAITSLAGDGDGVWVAGGARGDVAWVQAGRVARRIRIGEGTVNAVARAGNALWVSLATGAVSHRYRVIRIDPETGRRTGTVELGHNQPTALAAAGRELWIVTLGGTATLIH